MTYSAKEMTVMGFAQWIVDGKRARRKAHITGVQLARIAGVSKQMVFRVESRGVCGPSSAAKLQRAYEEIAAGKHSSAGWYPNMSRKAS